MKNRARCKLCNDMIESVHRHDYVTCSCGEISIDGGSGNGYSRCRANDHNNLIMLDDDGNEIVPTVTCSPKDDIKVNVQFPKLSKQEGLDMLQAIIDRIDSLPPQSLYAPITHADFSSLLKILSGILRSD